MNGNVKIYQRGPQDYVLWYVLPDKSTVQLSGTSLTLAAAEVRATNMKLKIIHRPRSAPTARPAPAVYRGFNY
jgi:riboflavin synthase alpha subunit